MRNIWFQRWCKLQFKSYFTIVSIILINFIINSISAQDGYSRAFNPPTDILISRDDEVYKATFTRDRIINLISEYNYWPEKWYVKVDLIEMALSDQENYKLTLYNQIQSNTWNAVEFKLGNYPCPTECQPPDPEFKNFLQNNYIKFDIPDIIEVLSQPNCNYIIVHASIISSTDFSFSIYGSVDLRTTLTGPHDKMFISITEKK